MVLCHFKLHFAKGCWIWAATCSGLPGFLSQGQVVASEQAANQVKPREKRDGVGQCNDSEMLEDNVSLGTTVPVSLSRYKRFQAQVCTRILAWAVPRAWECSPTLSVLVIAYLSHFIMSVVAPLPLGSLRVHTSPSVLCVLLRKGFHTPASAESCGTDVPLWQGLSLSFSAVPPLH